MEIWLTFRRCIHEFLCACFFMRIDATKADLRITVTAFTTCQTKIYLPSILMILKKKLYDL